MITKEEYIKNVVNIYERLLNQTVQLVNAKWPDLELDLTDVDFQVYCGNYEAINGDFEEQFVYTILGVLNMASVRSNLGVRVSPLNTEVDVVEFILNDEEKSENPNSSQIQ